MEYHMRSKACMDNKQSSDEEEEREEKRRTFKEKLLAFGLDAKLPESPEKAKEVFKTLLTNSADQQFLHYALGKKHYMELISFWISKKEPDNIHVELNQMLKNCDLKGYRVKEDMLDRVTPFENLKDDIKLTEENREKIYQYILKNCTQHARYIGHFLLSPTVYLKHYNNHSKMADLFDAIMTEVRQDVPISWAGLKELLLYIGCDKTAEKIEKEVLKKAKVSSRTAPDNAESVRKSSEEKLHNEEEEDKRLGRQLFDAAEEGLFHERNNLPRGYDVMLSYQWDSQSFVKELKDFLQENGLTVWMDVEQMHGNILARMQEAVNKSKVIVFCMTKKYELSNNCRLEYNYAEKREKIIIPVKLEDFKPSNELDIIIGNKFYYSFFNEGDVESTKVAFLKGIQKMIEKAD